MTEPILCVYNIDGISNSVNMLQFQHVRYYLLCIQNSENIRESLKTSKNCQSTIYRAMCKYVF